MFAKHQWLNPSVLISCSHAKKEIIPSSVNSWHRWSRAFPSTVQREKATQHPAQGTQNIILAASSVVPPPGICFRKNINHSGKGECLSGKHLGENCSFVMAWNSFAIKFSTSETPLGNSVLLPSSRARDSLEPKIESLLKTVVTQ